MCIRFDKKHIILFINDHIRVIHYIVCQCTLHQYTYTLVHKTMDQLNKCTTLRAKTPQTTSDKLKIGHYERKN